MQDLRMTKIEERARHWREIMLRAEKYPGSDYAFCVSAGITKSPFYSWKKKLNNCKTKKLSSAPSPFAVVEVTKSLGQSAAKRFQPPIDAKWVAEFIIHLHGGET